MTGSRELLEKGLKLAFGTAAAAARALGYDKSMMSKILAGERFLAHDMQQKVSKVSILAGLALAAECTGYGRWFRFNEIDRHPQTLIQVAIKNDKEADAVLQELPGMLINKATAEDLQPGDNEMMEQTIRALSARINSDINLLAEIGCRYSVDLPKMLAN